MIFNNLGKFKYLSDRWLVYISRTQFLMVAYLFMKESGIHWLWFLLAFILSLLFMVIDVKYILPTELDYITRKNPEWKRIFGDKNE